MNQAHIAHVALWTRDVDRLTAFYARLFGAAVGERYESRRRPGFVSRFLTLSEGATIEIMQAPWLEYDRNSLETPGYAHIAIALGSREAVDCFAKIAETGGFLKSPARQTGDGFYEAVLTDPDDNLIEITI